MKFVVEFKIEPGTKNKVVESFEMRGPNRTIGVHFLGAWVGKHTDVIYALGESNDENLLKQACLEWAQEGTFTITPVTPIDQF